MRRRGKSLEVSTFPFLAVLLCAMGSLILVLIVMDRKAKMGAREKALAAQSQANDELAKADAARREKLRQQEAEAQAAWEQKRDDLHTTLVTQQQVVQAQMKQVRDQLNAAAERLKAELDAGGALKQGIATERERLAGEEKSLATIRQDLSSAAAQTAAERAAQAKMTGDLAQLETALKNLQEARERDKQTYSVVPYHGKHGESRRPLYVECTRNGVIFHPDRIEMTLTNALAARAEVELRVKRQNEFLASIQAKTDDKPYLMLLVRPDGITSYYQIQSALRGIDLEYGYEFVDAGWLFDFSKEEERPAVAPPIVTGPPSAAPIPVGGPSGALVAVAPPIAVTPTGSHPDDGIGGGPSNPLFPGGSGGGGVGSPLPGNPPTAIREGTSGPVAGPGGGPSLGGSAPGGTSGSGGPAIAPPSVPTGPGAPVGPGSAARTDTAPAANPTTTPQAAPPDAPAGPGGPGSSPTRIDPPYRPAKPRTEFATDSDLHPTAGNGSSATPGQAGAAPAAVSGPQLAPGVADSTRPGGATQTNPSGTSSGGSPSKGGSTQQDGTPTDKDNGPRFAAPPSPKKNQPPPALKVARLNGDRDYIIFVECRTDDVVLYPSRQTFAVAPLTHGDQALAQAIKQMIDRKQALVRSGELPFRPQVRFLVRPDGIRSYHTTYPVLSGLKVPQTRQNLDADEDAIAVVTGQ